MNSNLIPIIGTTALGLLGVLAIATTAGHLASEVQERSAESAARSYATALTAVRDRYIQDIVQNPILKELGPDELQHFTYGTFPVAYELLNDVSEDLADAEQGQFRIFSDHPWPSRASGGPRTPIEAEILRAIVGGGEESVVRRVRRESKDWLVYAEPVPMRNFCVDCHNSHEQSPKRDWKTGDVRGVQLVEVALPVVPLFPTTSAWSSLGTIAAFSALTLIVCGVLLTRLQRSRQLVRRGELFHGLVHRAGDAMISIDEEGRITTFNLAAQEMLGYREEEVVGKSATLLMQDEDIPRHEAGFRAAIARGATRDAADGPVEVNAVTWAGEKIPVGMMVALVDGPEGKRIIGTLRDLRVTKRLEARLRNAEKNEAVGQLTAGIAHDFNNMLMVIGANAEAIRSDLTGECDVRPLDEMLETVGLAAQLTNHLLTVTGRQQLSPRRIHLRQEIPRLVDLLRRTLGTSIRIELSMASDAHDALADPGLFEAAVINLAMNARDSMPDGGSLTIQVGNTGAEKTLEPRPEGFVWLSFTDTGKGIPPEDLERVFEPFFSTKATTLGRGLGLSTVRGFVRQSGGEVILESSSGAGTCVSLLLPGVVHGDSAERPERKMHVSEGRKVLVVEDEAPVRKAVVRMLDRLGIESTQACNADEALTRLTGGERPDVVLTDVLMPGTLDGRQLALEIRRRFPEVGVVIVSGYSAHSDRSAETQHLRKPVRSEELAAAIQAATRNRAQA